MIIFENILLSQAGGQTLEEVGFCLDLLIYL